MFFNRLFPLYDEGPVTGDVGSGTAVADSIPTMAAGLPDPNPIVEKEITPDGTDDSSGDDGVPNPFELSDDVVLGTVPEGVLSKDIQEGLAKTTEGREVLESYAALQKYKEAGLASIPEPTEIKVAYDKAAFYDAMSEDLAKGDADAVLRGITTEYKDGQFVITPEGSKLISTLPNFLLKLPDAEYVQVTTPIIDQTASFLGEQAKTLYEQSLQHRGADGKYTPQGASLAQRANAYAIAMQAIEENLYGAEGVTKGEDILAGKRAKDSFNNDPRQQALARKQLELDQRERELAQRPAREITAQINNETNKNFNDDILAISKPLSSMFPNLTPKGVDDMARLFHKDVTQAVLNDSRMAGFRSLVRQAQEGGDPTIIKKAIDAHRGLTRRVAHEMWPKWVSEKTTAKVQQQKMKIEQAGKSAGANGTGGSAAVGGGVPPFRDRQANESGEQYRKAKMDHVWKHTGGKVWGKVQ